jgi:hypothetical protein
LTAGGSSEESLLSKSRSRRVIFRRIDLVGVLRGRCGRNTTGRAIEPLMFGFDVAFMFR